MLMKKWQVDIFSGDPFQGTTMYFYADDAELLTSMIMTRIDNKAMTISHTLEITANGEKFNFGIKIDEGYFTNLHKYIYD